MPQPYPGQQWKHGWKPLTPGAVKEKNHGRAPAPGSKLAKSVSASKGSSQKTEIKTPTPSERMDAAIRAKAGRGNNDSAPPRSSADDSPLRKEALDREASNPFGRDTIARDPGNVKPGQSVWAGNRWVKVKDDAEGRALSNYVKRHNGDLKSKEAAGPRLSDEAQEREASNPFGKDTIARDPNDIKIGQAVWAGNRWVKVKNKDEAKALSRYAARHLSDLGDRRR